jgi:hypothetical protein
MAAIAGLNSFVQRIPLENKYKNNWTQTLTW